MLHHNKYQLQNSVYPPYQISSYLISPFIKQTLSSSASQNLGFSSQVPLDSYSENSTSCGSEENNHEDFLDQIPQQQNSFNINSAPSKQSLQMQSKSLKSSPMIPEEAKYKTEMCKNWIETGKCNYGEKCKFAHGKNELVQKLAANKHFKTKLCKQFYEKFTCSYGSRCHFLHDIRSLSEILAVNFFQKRMANIDIYSNQQTSTSSQISKRLEVFNKLTSSSY